MQQEERRWGRPDEPDLPRAIHVDARGRQDGDDRVACGGGANGGPRGLDAIAREGRLVMLMGLPLTLD